MLNFFHSRAATCLAWPLARVGLTLACWLATSAVACASGFTVTRQVTTLEVRRTGHYAETVERSLRIDSPEGVNEHDRWSLTFLPERTSLEVLEAWAQTPPGKRIAVPRNRILARERAPSARSNLCTGRQAMVLPLTQIRLYVIARARFLAVITAPGHRSRPAAGDMLSVHGSLPWAWQRLLRA